MKTQFFDRQDPGNPMNGRAINDSMALLDVLKNVRDRPPFFAELIGDNGYKLLLGLAAAEGCVQFSAADGSPPYLMAVAPRAAESSGEISFLIGDTMSPVPKRYCLSLNQVVRIAAAFVETGIRSADVLWEEI